MIIYLFVLLVALGGNAIGDNLFDDKLLAPYKGKNVLVVNIATRCGYTPQLEGLEKLHQSYKDKNFVVVGVPSNDFGKQTPEEDREVVNFCKLNYGVSFPLTGKTVVKGPNKHPLFKKLTPSEEIAWNFEKFLINQRGELVGRFNSSVEPTSEQVKTSIEKLIQK